ncbi:chemotaxis protein MotB [Thioclava sp. SK-1]|uniref:flagellar motor protein MotB n=1 Tax=Thioclava sp. SK-1 TaxID=1889770 RepID=UPI0008245B36|nr:flagellar motor protein MotB [Thioclava sp. SK-1]OCX65286.1 chemotaxis protein MotB [Thioclava sp. SK-1]
MAEELAPIIIKKKKVIAGGGHHGGAWKVAYADFVTAMMAFFLLMWLLNATTEKQRKGIADYFSPTIPVNRISGGGDGAFGGDSVFSEDEIAQSGTGASMKVPTEGRQARGQNGTEEADDAEESGEFDQMAREIEEALMGRGGESMVSDQLARHILTRVTDEGLIVEFFDLDDEPLFAAESSTPEPVLSDIVDMLTRVFGLVDNEVALNGFTRAYPEMLRENPVWDLSTERVQVVRKMLQESGLNKARIQRVTGYADRKPASPLPMSVRNNRLELILLRADR